jgi:hypothetical protein
VKHESIPPLLELFRLPSSERTPVFNRLLVECEEEYDSCLKTRAYLHHEATPRLQQIIIINIY